MSRLEYIQTIVDVYVDTTGQQPGAMVMPTRVFRALCAGDEFQNQLIDGTSRIASPTQVREIIAGAGFPDITLYDRRVKVNGSMVRVLRDDTLLLLPAAVDPDDFQGTDLGATFWGRTLTSTEPEWAMTDIEQPGIVTGVWRNDKPPMGLEIIGDAMGVPALAQADRSLAAKVL